MSSAGLPSRGWAGPRAGTFAPRHRSGLARAFAKGGVARSWDWPLIFVTCGLTVLGTVLVWAATEPALRQAGLDPHTYLKKAAMPGGNLAALPNLTATSVKATAAVKPSASGKASTAGKGGGK